MFGRSSGASGVNNKQGSLMSGKSNDFSDQVIQQVSKLHQQFKTEMSYSQQMGQQIGESRDSSDSSRSSSGEESFESNQDDQNFQSHEQISGVQFGRGGLPMPIDIQRSSQ
jgi:hypothetical protein